MIGIILQNATRSKIELGRGGMGVVYRAQDRVLNRPVAIKIISESGSALCQRPLLAEAQAVARLNHPQYRRRTMTPVKLESHRSSSWS